MKVCDKAISTGPETFETGEKTVVETYIREDSKLIHLVINGEEIITTETHPFYVNKRGFVNAGELKVGDELLDSNGSILLLESTEIELTAEPTKVYNFQVKDFHTYYVGSLGVLVHNAGDDYAKPTEPYNRKKHYGNTPTKKDRQVVGGSPDHDPPLVKRYYEGDPSIGEKPGYQMTAAERRASAQDRSRMNPSTKAEQNSQGGRMSKYSKEMKKKYGLDKND
ncbi:MAG: polymorphic toxin-type HINT domain-containing protein [Oscillospiraceae bacterium]